MKKLLLNIFIFILLFILNKYYNAKFLRNITIYSTVKIKYIDTKTLVFLGLEPSFAVFNVKKCFSDQRFITYKYRISTSFDEFEKAQVVIFNPCHYNFKYLPKKGLQINCGSG